MKKLTRYLLLATLLLQGAFVQAQTVVNVSTALGEFSIELFDSQAPTTVQNFLNYVNSGRYSNSIVHRSVPGFVIQGGGFMLPEGQTTIIGVETDGPITNEPGISNTRGTVAMAKVAGNPDSATSQWFINLADNTGLDSDNGGFTVFGRVIGEGMTVADAIAALPRVSLGGALTELPVTNFNGVNVVRENLIFTGIEVQAQTSAPNRLDSTTGNIILRIDGGSAGIAEVAFAIESQEPSAVVRGLIETAVTLPGVESGYATFDSVTGQLVIPELDVGGTIAYRNLVFILTDAQQLLFTLQSFE